MGKRHVLFWFDVEDCTVPQSDDAAKRLAQILTRHGVRGTMKVVGQKARVLRDRVRYDVIDALSDHAIGYHANWHGLRPQPAEYMAPLDWLEGSEEFARREGPGLADLRALWGRDPVCYGQPGPNWSPQVFPVLRRWGMPAYVSGFGYVGLYAQPFWYGGIINTSHMYGRDRRERQVSHAFGLNFELGKPGAMEEHQRQFAASYEALEDGGLISIMNHPCTLVLQEWFSTELKPRKLTEAGYKHFEAFLAHVLSHEQTETVTAEELPRLYPDRARDRVFGPDELHALAEAVDEEVRFQEIDGMSVSAAELFGMFAAFLAHAVEEGTTPGAGCRYLDGPALPSGEVEEGFRVDSEAFRRSVLEVEAFVRSTGRLPESVEVGGRHVSPGVYYAAMARAVVHVVERRRLPERIGLVPVRNVVEGYVDEDAARSGWGSVMMRPGFAAPKLVEQARLQAWTLKPAVKGVPSPGS